MLPQRFVNNDDADDMRAKSESDGNYSKLSGYNTESQVRCGGLYRDRLAIHNRPSTQFTSIKHHGINLDPQSQRLRMLLNANDEHASSKQTPATYNDRLDEGISGVNYHCDNFGALN